MRRRRQSKPIAATIGSRPVHATGHCPSGFPRKLWPAGLANELQHIVTWPRQQVRLAQSDYELWGYVELCGYVEDCCIRYHVSRDMPAMKSSISMASWGLWL